MFDTMVRLVVFAQEGMGSSGEGEAAGDTAVTGCGGMQMLPFVLMIVVFYFLLIRPQSQRQKKHDSLVKALQKGDKVITNSGIYGRVLAVEDHTVSVEIAKNTVVKIAKNQVACLQQEGDAEKESEALRDAAA